MLDRRISAGLIGTAAVLSALLLFPDNTAAQSFNFVSVDVPCSSAPPTSCPNGISRRTAMGGINPAGDVVGAYQDGVGKSHGFLLSRGQFTSIDVPTSLVEPGAAGTLPTVARGIAPTGDIVGQFTAPYNPPASTTAAVDSAEYCPATGSTACIKGFVYSHGNFIAITFPGHPGAIPGAITPDGSLYGCLHDYDVMASMFSAAWIRSGNTFSYESLAAGGGALADPSQSFPNSMFGGATPDGNVTVGFYVDMMTNHTHGYVIQNGVLQTYDVPESRFTTVWDINPGQDMTGTYVDSAGHQHGFVQLRNASGPTTVDAPTAAPFDAVGTVFQGINPSGVLSGQYTDNKGHTHGLLAVPAATNE